MRKSRRPLIIASRTSPLAQAQAQMVAAALGALDPTLHIELRWIESEGDQKADAPLASVGGKGLFAKAVERSLIDGSADLAVHSFKDLPVEETPGLTIAATMPRADVRDCLVSHAGYAKVEDLPQGAHVGTASPRRSAQLLRLRPDLRISLIRGHVETRIRKVMEEKQFDATLLAMAGLHRGGLRQFAAHPIPVETMLPSAAQGVLAIQCRGDDHVTMRRCLPINDAAAGAAAHAERQVVGGLHGDCHSAIAALAELIPPPADAPPVSRQDRKNPYFRLRVRVLSADGKRCVEANDAAPARHVGKLAKRVLKHLVENAAADLLKT